VVVGAPQGQVVKILVTGAAGQLGRELVDQASTVEAVTREHVDVLGLSRADLDVTDPVAVRERIASVRPDVVVHAAAWTAVDACESDPQKAMLFNATATNHVVQAARAVDARVVYVSTDYVFDGTKPTPYVEDDPTNPQSVYGRSKLAGERAVDLSHDAIVRVSWLCGVHGANMVKTILKLMNEQPTLRFVDDQVGCPTFADDAARMILRLAAEQRHGIWHVTNQGAVSWFEFAREVLIAAGEDANRVTPVKTADLVPPRPAPRPANSVLENAALQRAGIDLLDDFRVPLARLVRHLQHR
jgi:dTDP-4-dehydrorhamnose reductase